MPWHMFQRMVHSIDGLQQLWSPFVKRSACSSWRHIVRDEHDSGKLVSVIDTVAFRTTQTETSQTWSDERTGQTNRLQQAESARSDLIAMTNAGRYPFNDLAPFAES